MWRIWLTVQDDARELELLALFNLTVPPERRRGEIDATLKLGDLLIPFELKSTTGSSISTVRDLGPDHISKWKDVHWIFGFYDRGGDVLQHCCYAPPGRMAAWIEQKERYVRPDVVLARHAPALITEAVLIDILGDKLHYTLADARLVQKNQYSAAHYRDRMDLPTGYSRQRMLEIVRERCRYLIRRGSTLNNPHIPASYFEGLERITENHASRLRQLVQQTLGL